jgi:hypothetical protein
MVAVVLQYGEWRSSHGRDRVELTDRNLAGSPFARYADRLRGVCVVMQQDLVITVKRNRRMAPGLLRRRKARVDD